jgi:bifunctional non-homologous end joining protein LigD
VALETYRKKRQFGITSEPRGRKGPSGGHRYVIQKHAARRLHYDLRLELDGVMKSWAVTRGPSLDPNEKRLAVQVEDHPVEYNTFEGTIPEGEYGGGTVLIWDRGRWMPEGDPHKGFAKGHLMFDLDGDKLHGHWHLVRMRNRPGDRHDNWLLIKGKDEYARSGRDEDILEEEPLSVVSGRSIEEIAGGKGKKRVWHSNRAIDEKESGRQSQRTFREELRAARGQASAKVGTKAGTKTGAKAEAKPRSRAKTLAKTPAKTLAKAEGTKASGSKTKDTRTTKKAVAKTAGVKKSAPGATPAPTGGRRAALPDFVPPSLATLHGVAPSGPAWLHEVKFDGYRIEARLNHRKVALLTRHRQDWTHRFPPIAQAVARLPAQTALLDGELVVEDNGGISNFSLLQTDLKDGRTDRFVYWAFDLLYLDGRDLTELPLVERKTALQQLLQKNGDSPLRYVEHFDEDGRVVFEHARKLHLEGIISKQRNAPYRSGRSDNFIKSKTHDEQEFVVAGFAPSAAMPRAVGALVAAFHEDGKLRYAGRIGTGYTRDTAHDLWKRLEKLRVERPPIALPPDERRKDVVWVKPQLVVEAEFRGITHDGLLRQASYKGVREDKPAREVVREIPAAAAATARGQAVRGQVVRRSATTTEKTKTAKRSGKPAGGASNLHLTHPDRVYWPDVGVTKEDLAEYYVAVWDWIRPQILGRALSLVRAPEGVGGETFFQKHIAANVKSSPLRRTVPGKDHDVIAVETLDDLIALVQSGALEIHVRGSRLDSLETCDRIVFDLDPGEGVSWKDIVAGARETRERLGTLKLESFVKLSGGKGIHVVLPIVEADWDTAKNFAQKIALGMAADNPNRYVGKMTKSLRDGRIFIDYFRNSREATSVAPYSSRARTGAPVSAPLTWEQLGRTTGANEFTVLNLKKRLRADPWRDIGKVRQSLPMK